MKNEEVEEKEEEKEWYVECLANLFHSKIKSTDVLHMTLS